MPRMGTSRGSSARLMAGPSMTPSKLHPWLSASRPTTFDCGAVRAMYAPASELEAAAAPSSARPDSATGKLCHLLATP
jgi:hypothetical protein